MHDFVNWLGGGKGQLLIGGAVGGLVRWLTLRSSLTDGLVSIIVGGLCAVYLSPLAQPAVNVILGGVVLDSDARISLTAFVLGIGGISVSGAVMDYWNAKRRRGFVDNSDEEQDDRHSKTDPHAPN